MPLLAAQARAAGIFAALGAGNAHATTSLAVADAICLAQKACWLKQMLRLIVLTNFFGAIVLIVQREIHGRGQHHRVTVAVADKTLAVPVHLAVSRQGSAGRGRDAYTFSLAALGAHTSLVRQRAIFTAVTWEGLVALGLAAVLDLAGTG